MFEEVIVEDEQEDLNDVSGQEPAQGGEKTPKEKQEPPQEGDDPNKGKKPTGDEEPFVEPKNRQQTPEQKANARMAFENRELKRQLAELNQRFEQFEKGQRKSEQQGKIDRLKSDINRLQDIDPEQAARLHHELVVEETAQRLDSTLDERFAAQAPKPQQHQGTPPDPGNNQDGDYQERCARVNQQLNEQFPELADPASGLMVEARHILATDYTPEEREALLATAPEFFLSVVRAAKASLEVKKIRQKQESEQQRSQRVGGHATLANQQTAGDDVAITPEIRDVAAKLGIKDVKGYARMIQQKNPTK